MLFGRLTSLQSPRQVAEQAASDLGSTAQTVAAIELLTTVAVDGTSAVRGIAQHPHLGSRIYQAPPQLLSWLFECSQVGETAVSDPVMLNLASLTDGTESV